MPKFAPIIAVFAVLSCNTAMAQSALAVPASSFTPATSAGGYSGNGTGTARFFESSLQMFAPVYLPDGAIVLSMFCGGTSVGAFRMNFTLRRNQPQQANVDMAVAMSSFGGGYEFVFAPDIIEPVIDNDTFNYYIVAEPDNQDVGTCQSCSVNLCSISYV